MAVYYEFGTSRTKIALGVFDSGRRSQWEKRMPTPRDNYGTFLDVMCKLMVEADQRFGCGGSVGVDISGIPEIGGGTLYTISAPVASDKPLRTDLNARLDCDVRLDNDANYFAPSETWDDGFTQYPLVVGLILGAGVDGELTFNGKPVTGKNYITGEFGRMRLPVDVLTMMGLDFPLRHCGCDQHDCIENYLSGRGFAWLHQYYYHQPLQAPEIITLYDQGGEQARAYVERYLNLSAVCLGDILTIVDPDLVVIGDGLSNFPAITTQLVGRLPRRLLPAARVPCIERTRHGDVGGVRGTAFLRLTD